MNAEQKAIDAWFKSAEGKTCCDIDTLLQSNNRAPSEFLRNRLWKAFTEGMAQGAAIQRDRIVKEFVKLIGG